MINDPSKEYNVADLLREIEGLKAERDLFRDAFLRIYNASAAAYSAKGKDEKKAVAKYARTVEGVDPDDRPGYLASMGEVMIEALAEAPSITVVEGEGRFTYSIRTRTENRALALVEHVRTTGKASIKSTEARAVLETHEGKPLDRKVVLRALEVAQGILRATSDKVGGVTRLILSTSSRRPSPTSPQEGESHNRSVGGGGPSRPRRWAVPWDGED
jgi:hypothetical protein